MNKLIIIASVCSITLGISIEGGYYPSGVEYGYSNFRGPEYSPKYVNAPIFQPAYQEGYPYGSAGYGPRIIETRPYVGVPAYPYHGYGGEVVDKNVYSNGRKNFNDEVYEKASGQAQEQADHGQNGYNQNQIALREGKGDSEHYSDLEGGRRAHGQEKQYSGGEFYGQGGENERENKLKQGHKKGHFVKGFKTSHHKDESGKTEEYFDEANDEGDRLNFEGQSGNFKENAGSSFRGGHEDGENKEKLHKVGGYYDNNRFTDRTSSDHGKFGENAYARNGRVYGKHNGVDQESLLGNQESSKFYKHSPYLDNFYRY